MKNKTPKGKININVILLGFVSFFTDISSEIIVKILPLFLETIGAGGAFIGVIEGLAESVGSFFKIISGWISDRIKNRKLLTFLGYAESAVLKAFLPFTTSPAIVLFIRAFERIGKGIRTAPRDALIASYSEKSNRGFLFGIHRALDTLGAAIGPLLAILILKVVGESNYAGAFKIALIPAFIALIFFIFIKEKRVVDKITKKEPHLTFRFSKKFYFFVIIVTIFTLGNSSDAFITLRSQNLGYQAFTILFLWFLHSIVYAVLSPFLGRMSDLIGRKKTIILGYGIYALSYLGFALTNQKELLFIIFPLYGIYYALTEGVQKAMVADIVTREEIRGTAYGIYNFGIGIMSFPASVIAGVLYQYVSPASPFYFGGILAFISSILLFFI